MSFLAIEKSVNYLVTASIYKIPPLQSEWQLMSFRAEPRNL